MSLKEPIVVRRQASKRPSFAVKRMSTGVGDKKLSVVAAHRVRKAAVWYFSVGEYFRRLPIRAALVLEDAKLFGTATDIQLPFVAGNAVESGINTRLATVFPSLAAKVAID